LIIAADWGGCCRRVQAESPGKLERKPLARAMAKVDKMGEKRAAWANATISDGVAVLMAALAVWGVDGPGRSTCQRCVVRVCWP
jgi:hypothetical protein